MELTATWIYRYEDLVARDECLVVETECGEFPLVVHLECPRLPDRNTINHLSVRDTSDLDENMRMRIDQLEFPHFHFNDEALLTIVNVLDPVVTLRSGTPKQDDSVRD